MKISITKLTHPKVIFIFIAILIICITSFALMHLKSFRERNESQLQTVSLQANTDQKKLNENINLLASRIDLFQIKLSEQNKTIYKLEREVAAQNNILNAISSSLEEGKHERKKNTIELISTINKAVEYLNSAPKYDPAQLPFSLISIDSIAGRDYAVIKSQNNFIPLVKNQVWKEWTVKEINRGLGSVSLLNEKNQIIKLRLQA